MSYKLNFDFTTLRNFFSKKFAGCGFEVENIDESRIVLKTSYGSSVHIHPCNYNNSISFARQYPNKGIHDDIVCSEFCLIGYIMELESALRLMNSPAYIGLFRDGGFHDYYFATFDGIFQLTVTYMGPKVLFHETNIRDFNKILNANFPYSEYDYEEFENIVLRSSVKSARSAI